MRPAELEDKVLAIIDRVRAKQPVEGSHVELKAAWIEPKKAARRLAACCNASRGDPVLWIVGIDEDKGVVGAANEELSDWWAKVRAEFDREPPHMALSMPVHSDGMTVVALLFDSARAPFVTLNPAAGQTGSGPVELEVPWREGNATRSARREDLLRILVPAVRAPSIEVLSGTLIAHLGDPTWLCDIQLNVYATVRGPTVFVAHRSTVTVEPPQFEPQLPTGYRITFSSGRATEWDVALPGPGYFQIHARGPMQGIGPVLPREVSVAAELGVVDYEARPVVSAAFRHVRQATNAVEYQIKQQVW